MKYESVKLLFQQDKYVQITSVLMLIVFGYSFYHLSTSLVSNLKDGYPKTVYEVHTGDITIRNEVYSGKSWVLKFCNAPSGYCWESIGMGK